MALVLAAVHDPADRDVRLSGKTPEQGRPCRREHGGERRVQSFEPRRRVRADRGLDGSEALFRTRDPALEGELRPGEGGQVERAPPGFRLLCRRLLHQLVLPLGEVGVLQDLGILVEPLAGIGAGELAREQPQAPGVRAHRGQPQEQDVPALVEREERDPAGGRAGPAVLFEEPRELRILVRAGEPGQIDPVEIQAHLLLDPLDRSPHAGQALEGGAEDLMPLEEPVQGVLEETRVELPFEQKGALRAAGRTPSLLQAPEAALLGGKPEALKGLRHGRITPRARSGAPPRRPWPPAPGAEA